MAAIKEQIGGFNALHSPKVIQRVFFFGGLSKSPHVRKTISKRFFDEEVMGYPVDVIMPSASLSEVVVAKGAVLKSLRGDIITRRFRRRNFGIVEDIPLICFPNHQRSTLKAFTSIEDNEPRVRNRMVLLFRNREAYSEQSIRVQRGWNSMPLSGPMRFRFTLVSSPHELEQYADILHPSNEVTCAGFLEFDLNEKERSQFPIIRNTKTRKEYYYFQYEVRFTLEYLWRHFEVVIPRTGVFPNNWRPASMNGKDADARLKPDPIKKGMPILRQMDQKDVEEDPKHIFEFQDQQQEELKAWKARGPDGRWDTAPRNYPRPSSLRQTQAGDLNTVKRGASAKEPILDRQASTGGVRKKKKKKKKNKFLSCERCVRTRAKCQRPSVKDNCCACEKASANCTTNSGRKDIVLAAENPPSIPQADDQEPWLPDQEPWLPDQGPKVDQCRPM
ncbi:MAG: hypothetical protein Q9176_005369 [Flavoplaca citrina]